MRLTVFASVLVAWLAAGTASATAQNPTPPRVSTQGVTEVGQRTATLNGRVNPGGAQTTYRFQYGTTTSYGVVSRMQTLPAGATTADVRAALSNLTASTTYHYRVVATNAAGTTNGADRTFKTAAPPAKPGVSTRPAKDVVVDAATLQGGIDPNGQATSYAFEYGTTTRYGVSTPAADAGSGTASVPVSARVGGLVPNTLYHFRVRASNPTGVALGADRTFRTGKIPLALAATASTPTVRFGQTVTVSGIATGTDRTGVPVVLERRGFPFTAGFAPFGSQQLTDAAGIVRFVVPPFTVGTQFRVTAPSRGGVESAPVAVAVRPAVRLRVQRLARGRVRLFGTVAPGGLQGSASVQRRLSTGRYVTLRRVTLRPGPDASRFSTVLRARSTSTVYRIATRLTGGAVVDGRSLPRRVAGR